LKERLFSGQYTLSIYLPFILYATFLLFGAWLLPA